MRPTTTYKTAGRSVAIYVFDTTTQKEVVASITPDTARTRIAFQTLWMPKNGSDKRWLRDQSGAIWNRIDD